MKNLPEPGSKIHPQLCSKNAFALCLVGTDLMSWNVCGRHQIDSILCLNLQGEMHALGGSLFSLIQHSRTAAV
jgi:hypothetical protein